MEVNRYLAEIAKADPAARRAALEAALAAEGFTPEIQEVAADAAHRAARNYLIRSERPEACPLF